MPASYGPARRVGAQRTHGHQTRLSLAGSFCSGQLEGNPEADPGLRPALRLPDVYERAVRAHAGRIVQHLRHQALGRNGAVLYGASCNCEFSHNYPFAFGPRLGGAYQIDSKTVLRGGAGIQYDVAEAPNGVLYSAADYYTINPNGYGISPMQNTCEPGSERPAGRQPLRAGNPFGNVPVVWPNLNQNKYPFFNNGIGAPAHALRFSSTRTIVRGESSPGASAYNAK